MKIVNISQITTLLLDYKFSPVGLLNARDAFTCFYANKMSAFDKDYNLFKDREDWYAGQPSLYEDQPAIRSVSASWAIPTILQSHRKFVWNSQRRKVTLREMCQVTNFTCQICHKKYPFSELTREHILPRALKGSNDLSNLTVTCKSCNSAKGHIHPYFDIYGQPLKPIKIPNTLERILDLPENIREEWKTFLQHKEVMPA